MAVEGIGREEREAAVREYFEARDARKSLETAVAVVEAAVVTLSSAVAVEYGGGESSGKRGNRQMHAKQGERKEDLPAEEVFVASVCEGGRYFSSL
jgi:hypothetical protein